MVEDTVAWTSTAVKQRRTIFEYWTLKNHSTAYATKLMKLINKRGKLIARYPESYQLTIYPGSRVSTLGHFSMIYKISGRQIIITAFWDNRQDPKKLSEVLLSASGNKKILPQHVIEGIKRGHADFEAGRSISFEEFKKRLDAKL
ncbi:type II toxin-antitoxin system RelE/ParE family toxin [Pedobacter heparinus]|uniref:type II toxin-antitoxin system RelE/ParE family toxin n=1 Tax=Pedobacter heparinus TaxID=984 RepID=UPI002931EEC3|nr:type II toxin-antitoxin system RelE/ParE family toxin [Pedobacter heparinus]